MNRDCIGSPVPRYDAPQSVLRVRTEDGVRRIVTPDSDIKPTHTTGSFGPTPTVDGH